MEAPTTLSGRQEVPPVTTLASGTTTIRVWQSKCPASASSLSCPEVAGVVNLTGLDATAVDIQQGAPGTNGPVVVTLRRTDTPNQWEVVPFTFLSSDQYDAYLAGNLYVNAHSDKNKGGEVRAQLKP